MLEFISFCVIYDPSFCVFGISCFKPKNSRKRKMQLIHCTKALNEDSLILVNSKNLTSHKELFYLF